MLFNSYLFIFIFLPSTLLGFYLIGAFGPKKIAIAWLISASLIFYAWWNPSYVILVVISTCFNYGVGVALRNKSRKATLVLAITANLLLLAYFKYANFFVDNLNVILRDDVVFESVVLPLAISFFTFQQITYLVDTYRGEVESSNFVDYCLFVTFFPQLIAGPIVHHKEMMPQFRRDSLFRFDVKNLSIGLTIFLAGLFKKVVLADGLANNANAVFIAAENGAQVTFFEAWGGVLAYTLQLYFDFSGYSDMAIGLARMFGVTLPLNFFSPYKATSVIEFWNRWHITLSRFLREYVYIPLGGNRKGMARRYINLMMTMLLGGLWHGAGWTFVIWGGLHGFYLIVNHAWRWVKNMDSRFTFGRGTIAGSLIAWLVTFFSVSVAWVVFRAETLDGAINVYTGMFLQNGISIPSVFVELEDPINRWLPGLSVIAGGLGSFGSATGMLTIVFTLVVATLLPNTIEWMRNQEPALEIKTFANNMRGISRLRWTGSIFDSLVVSIFFYLSLIYMSLRSINEFLYFNF